MRLIFSALILLVFALFIWLRDTAWMSSAADTLPILAAIPLFFWLGTPWNFKEHPLPFSKPFLLGSALIFALGILFNLTVLLAASWTLLLLCVLSSWSTNAAQPNFYKLLPLPLMAFPWIVMDANTIGWWFRLSGAWATEHIFNNLGMEVIRQGTFINVSGLPLSIEAACSGLNTLQSLLIAGTAVDYLILKDTPLYWWNLPMLVLFAWITNTIRIFALALAALLVSPEFSLGAFHTWGGLLIILMMFGLCWAFFSLQEPTVTPKNE